MEMSNRICKVVTEMGLKNENDLQETVKAVKNNIGKIAMALADHRAGEVTEKEILDAVAEERGLKYVDLSAYSIDPEAVKLVSRKTCEKYGCIPLEESHRKQLYIAAATPLDYEMVQDLSFATNKNVIPCLAYRGDIDDAIDRFYDFASSMEELMGNVSQESDIYFIDNKKAIGSGGHSYAVVKIVNSIMVEAVSKGASDVHLEPYPKLLKVKTRVDGQLKTLMNIPKWIQAAVISRIKIIAKMDITEKRVPQDGKVSVKISGESVDFRVSTLPTNYGEKTVIRVLDKSNQLTDISTLGLEEKELSQINKYIKAQQGMILVTGPTGSGKTTLLYAMLNQIRKKAINIITVEDPIEYEMEGTNQVQINEKAGLNFANTLRSILRQDPDVIMVGEIRDRETAEIAFRASQTGHLVISTLHTNSATSTIARLKDIGVEPYMISSSLLCIIAQRLVRRNCPLCAETYEPNEDALNRFKDMLPPDVKHKSGKGCSKCNATGYKGRTGVYEMLSFTPEIIDAVNMQIPEEQLKKAARQNGMGFLIDRCAKLIIDGTTSVDECSELAASTTVIKHTCPSCAEEISPDFSICPYCQYFLSRSCPQCKNPIELGWKSCPFCMTILQAPKSVSTDEQKGGEKEVPMGRKSMEKPLVLVVDDEAGSRKGVSLSLKQINCEAIEAGDGREALEKVQLHHPDLIISDINMPNMDGYELCKSLRQNATTTFIPFIMMTSRDTAEDKLKGYAQGTDDYITKPFEYDDLMARVQRHLARAYPEYR